MCCVVKSKGGVLVGLSEGKGKFMIIQMSSGLLLYEGHQRHGKY